jgi:hypothetical protein
VECIAGGWIEFIKPDVDVNRARYVGRDFCIPKLGAKSMLPILDSVYLTPLANPPRQAASDDYVYRVESGSFR